MGLIEILWTATSVAVPLLLGTAWSMVGLSPPEFWIARGCIILAAIIVGGVTLIWLASTPWHAPARIIASILIGAVAVTGFSEAIRWVNGREDLLATQAAAVQDKRAAVRTQLHNFYIASTPLLNRNIPKDISDQQFWKYQEEVTEWINNTHKWIQETLGEGAAQKFLDTGSGFTMSWNRAANEQHNNIINLLSRYRDNLSKLIETSAWDAPQHT